MFGFLSFAGFEGAASLGEETDNPRREIPRAIRNAVIGSGIFYILCILVQTWGFGADAAGAKAFAGSAAPLGDLARSYVGSCDVGRDQRRRHGERVRQRARRRHRRRPDPVRAQPGHAARATRSAGPRRAPGRPPAR